MAAAGRRIQDIPLDYITWADLETLCENGVEEGPTLEFKSGAIIRLHKDETERQMRERVGLEIAEAICAFANAEGGTIILGVADDDDVAEAIVPIEALAENAMSFEDRAKDAVDPRPYTARFRPIPDPADATRGVLVIRVGASQLAPHGAKMKVEKYRNKKIDAPVAFIRDGKGNKVMTMRDVQSSFWDARSARERIEALRREQDQWLEDAQKLNDRRWTSPLGGFFRCTAILHVGELRSGAELRTRRNHLQTLFTDLRGPNGHELGMTPNLARAFPTAGGWTLPVGRNASALDWIVEDSGLVQLAGLSESSEESRDVQFPQKFVNAAIMTAAVAHRFRVIHGMPDTNIEIDMRLSGFSAAVIGNSDHDRLPNVAIRPRSGIGPYLLRDLAHVESLLKNIEERIWASFAIEAPNAPSLVPDDLSRQIALQS